MSTDWKRTFRHRMAGFESARPNSRDDVAVSIKVRVMGGCFHREHSPHAYEIIDRYLNGITETDRVFAFEEHESGPEVLVYLAVTTAALALTKSVVDLITTILKARSESVKKGDHPREPVELIVRKVNKIGEVDEIKVLRIGHEEPIDESLIKEKLDAAAKQLASQSGDKSR